MVRRRSPAVRVCLALISFVLVGGCASSPSAAPDGDPSVSVLASASATAVREITVDVTDGAITPPPASIEVSAGEALRVTVTSDAPDEVHIHGVDVTGRVAPGAPFTAEITPTQSGTFEVELHESGALLFQLLVR